MVLVREGAAMRYFPVGAKASIHVPLAVVEDLAPDSRMEVQVAAPGGARAVVLDVGFLEIA